MVKVLRFMTQNGWTNISTMIMRDKIPKSLYDLYKLPISEYEGREHLIDYPLNFQIFSISVQVSKN